MIHTMWDIGQRLRQQRERANLTQGQVAAFEKCDVNYISKLERGVNKPNVWPMLARLARRYRTTTDYLLGNTEDPNPPEAQLSEEEAALLALWRGLPDEQRVVLRQLLADGTALADIIRVGQVFARFNTLPGSAEALDDDP